MWVTDWRSETGFATSYVVVPLGYVIFRSKKNYYFDFCGSQIFKVMSLDKCSFPSRDWHFVAVIFYSGEESTTGTTTTATTSTTGSTSSTTTSSSTTTGSSLTTTAVSTQATTTQNPAVVITTILLGLLLGVLIPITAIAMATLCCLQCCPAIAAFWCGCCVPHSDVMPLTTVIFARVRPVLRIIPRRPIPVYRPIYLPQQPTTCCTPVVTRCRCQCRCQQPQPRYRAVLRPREPACTCRAQEPIPACTAACRPIEPPCPCRAREPVPVCRTAEPPVVSSRWNF